MVQACLPAVPLISTVTDGLGSARTETSRVMKQDNLLHLVSHSGGARYTVGATASAPLTLLVAERLLQHGEDDRVVQHKVAEVAGSRGAQSGVADKGVFVQQAAGGGGPAGRREGPQHLHDTGETSRQKTSLSLSKSLWEHVTEN